MAPFAERDTGHPALPSAVCRPRVQTTLLGRRCHQHTRFQQSIRRLKRVIAEYDVTFPTTSLPSSPDQTASSSSESPCRGNKLRVRKPHVSTVETIDRAAQLIKNSATAHRRRGLTSVWAHQPGQMRQETSQSPTSDESAPPSPAASSTTTSSVDVGSSKLGGPSVVLEQPPTGSRLYGMVHLKLPEGIVLDTRSGPCQEELPAFEAMLPRGVNLLELLQGKGAQTLLLNAFCGQARRRMYARIKYPGLETRPFELLCDFTPDASNPSVCTATIQVNCLHLAGSLASPDAAAAPVVFTTRHNASCALIYLDSASIPSLGHFPSEISGKSVFTLVHVDDVGRVQQAHQQLHSTNGSVVSTPGLRLVSHAGHVVTVDSEWSAFVNPWTRSIEMVVGRHCICPSEPSTPEPSAIIAPARYRELDASIHSLLSKPVTAHPHLQAAASTVPPAQPSVKQFVDDAVQCLVTASDERTEVKVIEGSSFVLSYNQINCLENVHRLLKSQSKFADFEPPAALCPASSDGTSPAVLPPNPVPLTQEVLRQHNRKWEAECKDTWRKRLTGKRIAVEDPSADAPRAPKTPRLRTDPPATHSISTTPLPPPTRRSLPPLPCPAPTPVDQAAWTEYVKIVQLHLQNMATYEHRAAALQLHHQAHEQRQLAALAMTLQQVQLPHHHHAVPAEAFHTSLPSL